MAHVKQKEKIVPLTTCEIILCQYVCELVFGVEIFDLKLQIQIDSVEHPVKRKSVGSGYMSHCWNDHLDHCFIIFKNVEDRNTNCEDFTFEKT